MDQDERYDGDMTSSPRQGTVAGQDVRVRDVPRRTFVTAFGRSTLLGTIGAALGGCAKLVGDPVGDEDHLQSDHGRLYTPVSDFVLGGDVVFGDGVDVDGRPRLDRDYLAYDPRTDHDDGILGV